MRTPAQTWLAAVATVASLVAGCSADTGARAGADRLRPLEIPLIVDIRVSEDWIDGDALDVIVRDDLTDTEARRLWCDVLIPNGLGERDLPIELSTAAGQSWDPPRDCSDKQDVPKRQR